MVAMNILFLIVAYLVGSIPFGYLAGRLCSIDLREHGSHNIGATNAVRVLGVKRGLPVFFCDFLKGYVPLLWMVHHQGGDVAWMAPAQMAWVLGTMFALVLGHTFTCFLHFRGGKGVATTVGCLFAFSPAMGGVTVAVWLVCVALTRYVSLSSMVAGLAMLLAAGCKFWVQDGQLSSADGMALGVLLLLFVLVVLRHRQNIVRLMEGREPKIFEKH